MPRPTETALKGRARALLEAMTERARWIYALPRGEGPAAARAVAAAKGLRVEEDDAQAGAARFTDDGGRASLVLFDSPDLDVALVEASGPEAPPILADILERTGFYAQSTLLGTALDVRDPEAPKALRTLAHMVVAWDEDWSDLFLLHLAAPDPVVRHDAVVALTVAVMVAHDAGPALALLDEAIRHEKFPKLKETMSEARNVVSGIAGGPVEIPPEPAP
jgi:predicted nuclease of predicted toxin-antitoxin system